MIADCGPTALRTDESHALRDSLRIGRLTADWEINCELRTVRNPRFAAVSFAVRSRCPNPQLVSSPQCRWSVVRSALTKTPFARRAPRLGLGESRKTRWL